MASVTQSRLGLALLTLCCAFRSNQSPFRKYFLVFCGLGWTEFSTRLFSPATLALKKILLRAPHLLQTFFRGPGRASGVIARNPTERRSPALGLALVTVFTESLEAHCPCGAGGCFSHFSKQHILVRQLLLKRPSLSPPFPQGCFSHVCIPGGVPRPCFKGFLPKSPCCGTAVLRY